MSIIFSLFISSIGLAYFMYGKKAPELSFLLFGVALMVYPYFVHNLILSIFIGLLLCALPFITKRMF